jgi:hypothetical protein
MPYHLQNLQVHYRVHKNLALVPNRILDNLLYTPYLFNPSLLWSKNLALLVLWGLRNPKLFFYLEIKKTFLFSNINRNMFNEPF